MIGTYLYLPTMSTDHVNHFDVWSFFYWIIYLPMGAEMYISILYQEFIKTKSHIKKHEGMLQGTTFS